MNFTNKNNLPERIIRLLPKPRQPKPDRFSVTQLIDSPRIRTLQLKNWEEIERDYSDLLPTLIGMAMHERSERLSLDEETTEQKIETRIAGVTLVGKSDCYVENEETVRDTKTKGVGFASYGDAKLEIERQLNCYAFQLRTIGKKVSKLESDIFYRDWKLWEMRKDIPKWAVMKEGRKTAVKLFDSEKQAREYMMDGWRAGEGLRIEERPSKGYPKTSYECLEIPLWTFEEQEKYITEQIHYHTMAPMDCSNTWNGLRCKDYCPCRSVCKNSPCYRRNP